MSDPKDKEVTLEDKLKLKGAQQMTVADYQTLKTKQNKPQFKLPPVVKWILAAPFIAIFAAGVIFLPFMVYRFLTSPSAPPPIDEPVTTTDENN